MSGEAVGRERARGERHVGSSVTRVDAPGKVTGETEYTMDIDPGRLLHAALVTSDVAHGRLLDIDTAAAEALDGVEAIATYDDVPDTRRGAYILDQPILSADKVRYVGEPIAVVAAETPAIAAEAAGLVDVEVERLDHVMDLDAAFSRDPPAVLHEDVREYEFTVQGDPRYGDRGHLEGEDAERPNVLYKDAREVGDVDAAFDRADHVIEGTYEVRPFQHCAMEPHVAIARARGSDVTIWSSQQVPHQVTSELAMAYPDLEPSDITIRTPAIGGGFGGKETSVMEARVLAVARLVDRPVRLALSRDEVFTVTPSRPQAVTRIRDAVTADGDLLARDADIRFNVGGYNENIFKAACSGPSALVGAYAIDDVRWESYAVYTNHPPYGAFRGFGKPEVNWGIERHMDVVARALDMDPLDYRARNLLREGDRNAKGEVLGPNDTEGCLRAPVEAVRTADVGSITPDGDEWSVGIGFAYGSKPVSRAAAAATVYVRSGMRIEVHTGAPDIGQGSDTALSQITAEAFDVGIDRVEIVAGDTDRTPYDRGPTGSRVTYHTGNAVRKAAAAAKETLLSHAAREFDGVDPADLETAEGRVFVRGDPDRAIDVDALFSSFGQQVGVSDTMLEDGGELVGTATYDARRGGEEHAFWTPVGQAAIVAVNTLTGVVEVGKFVTACDVGRAINPKAVEGQLEGGAAQGIASALYEEIVFDGGRVFNPSYKDYRIPGITELPYDSETIILESRDDEGPFGAKGVGEMGMMAAAPAVGNAIRDAVGIDFDVAPVTPERVLEGLIEP